MCLKTLAVSITEKPKSVTSIKFLQVLSDPFPPRQTRRHTASPHMLVEDQMNNERQRLVACSLRRRGGGITFGSAKRSQNHR